MFFPDRKCKKIILSWIFFPKTFPDDTTFLAVKSSFADISPVFFTSFVTVTPSAEINDPPLSSSPVISTFFKTLTFIASKFVPLKILATLYFTVLIFDFYKKIINIKEFIISIIYYIIDIVLAILILYKVGDSLSVVLSQ